MIGGKEEVLHQTETWMAVRPLKTDSVMKGVCRLMTEGHRVVTVSVMIDVHRQMTDSTDAHHLMIVCVMTEGHLVEVGETEKEIGIETEIFEIDHHSGKFEDLLTLIMFHIIVPR